MQPHKSNDCLLNYTSKSKVTDCISIADKARLLDQLRTVQMALETDDNKKAACTLRDAALKAAVMRQKHCRPQTLQTQNDCL